MTAQVTATQQSDGTWTVSIVEADETITYTGASLQTQPYAPPVAPPPPPSTPPPSTSPPTTFRYVTGFDIMPPDYTSHPNPPAQGASFVDGGTGATIERLTDSSSYGTSGSSYSSLRNLYSQFAADSYDGKYFIAVDENSNVYVGDTATGAKVCDIHGINENCAPRWDYSGDAPSALYYVDIWQYKLFAFDAATQALTLVHDFNPDLAAYGAVSIFMDGHADTDMTSRYFPIQMLGNAGDGSWYALALTVYDRRQDKIVAAITPADVPAGSNDMAGTPPHPLGDIHSAPFSVSRDGKYVAVQWQAPSTSWNANLIDTTRDGAHCYALTFDANGNVNGIDIPNGKRTNPSGPAHMCWVLDSAGKAWYVAQNTATDWIEAVDPAVGIGPRSGDATQTLSTKIVNIDTAKNFGWPKLNGNMHFSAPYKAPFGWFAALFDADLPSDATIANANQTMVFALKSGATPLRISPTYHGNPGKGGTKDVYSDQHYGSVSQDGSTFYWASNWCNDAGQRDLYKIALPAGWQAQIP